MSDIEKLMALLNGEGGDEARPAVQPNVLCRELKNRVALLNEPRDFEVGDFVTWKDGLKNKKDPQYGDPVLVVELRDEPLYEMNESAGTPYFHEPLDMCVATIEDGMLLLFWFDSRRFRKMTEEELKRFND